MNILIAPNAFKNSLGAKEVAAAIQQRLQQSRLNCNCICFPIGDGGDGTGELIVNKCGGISTGTAAHDPLGRLIQTSIGYIDAGKTAVVEMANASGIRLLHQHELNPLHASSYGTGEQIKIALDNGVNKIIMAMGGSATVDGGVGMLQALGVRFLDADGSELKDVPYELMRLASIDIGKVEKRIHRCQIVILCDVNNYLLGTNGAAHVFGPQKGASADDVVVLEKALGQFAVITKMITGKDITNIKRGGTAGGAAAGLYAFLQADLVNGIDYFLDITGFDKALASADVVITGEGSIDEQTLQGKGPYGVAQQAGLKGIPVIALAGKTDFYQDSLLYEYFKMVININKEPFDVATALENTGINLISTSRELGNLLAENKSICVS